METHKLIRMANEIAAFFHAYPEDEAANGISEHLLHFWTPKMRDILAAAATAPAPEDPALDPLVKTALRAAAHPA